MSHGSCALVTCCRQPPELVGLQFLDESQMQWSSADVDPALSGTETHGDQTKKCQDYSTSGTSSRRQATVESESLPVLQCPTHMLMSCLENVAVSKRLEELAREVARVQGQPSGKQEDSETSDENGPPPVPKPARVVTGRRHQLLSMLVDHLMCRDGRSEESLPERRAVRTLAARRNYQIALGTFLTFVKERPLPLVEDVDVDGALVVYSDDCCVQGMWQSSSAFCG